ncbi:MAG: hypothetical protein ISS18_14990 [Bacteroidales bacterium]|nr:hypothetical protein [Bacteroidales bacterium]
MEFNTDEIKTKEMQWYYLDYPNDPGYIEIIKVNESGLIIEIAAKQKKIRNMESCETKTNYSYNQSGFETEMVLYINGKFCTRWETIFDEFNCKIKKIIYDENNEIENYYINEFDNRNRKISSSKFSNKNVLEKKWVKEYDDSDEWVIRYTYDSDGKLLDKDDKRESYKTNKINSLYTSRLPDERFKDIEHYTNGKVRTWHYKNSANNDIYQTYDENGRIIERKIYRNDEWIDTFTWKYREDGSIIEESESTSRVVGKSYYKKSTYYRVDFNGNWIEKYIIDSEGNVTELAIREIEYY